MRLAFAILLAMPLVLGIEMSVSDLIKVFELGEQSVGSNYNKVVTGWLTGIPLSKECIDHDQQIDDVYSTYNFDYVGDQSIVSQFDGIIDTCWEYSLLKGGAEEMCKEHWSQVTCCAFCEEHVGGAEDHLCEVLDMYGELTCTDGDTSRCTGANLRDSSCNDYLKGKCDASCEIHGYHVDGCSKRSDYVKGSNCIRQARAVPGCTDSDATNYNAAATEDDGSCQHAAPEPVCSEQCETYLNYYTCDQLAQAGMDCSPCDCTAKCSDTCQQYLPYYSCDVLLSSYGMDCSACDCTPKCSDTCTQYLEMFTCDKLASEYGMDCSACSQCSCSQCGPYLSGYSCADLESTYAMDCQDCVGC